MTNLVILPLALFLSPPASPSEVTIDDVGDVELSVSDSDVQLVALIMAASPSRHSPCGSTMAA